MDAGTRWIACDLDNTICLQAAALRRELRKRYGISVPGGPSFDAYGFASRYGVTRAQLEDIFRAGDVFRNVSVRPGARAALAALRAAGYRIAIVTDRFWYDAIGGDTERWLRENAIPFDELALVRAAEKAAWTRSDPARRVVAFFEDRLDTALEVARVVPSVYLMDFPWNRTAEALPANVHRASNWLTWRRMLGPGLGLPAMDLTAPVDPVHTERPLVIGLTGLPGAGKDSVFDALRQRGFVNYRFSDVIREEGVRRGRPELSRTDLQDIGDELRTSHGPGVLAERLAARITADGTRLAIINGVRNPAEWRAFRGDTRLDTLLVAIEVDAGVRFERVRERGRDGDPLTWEDFATMDARDAGDGDPDSPALQVGLVMEMADAAIDNSGTPEELAAQIDELLAHYLPGETAAAA